MSNNTPVSKLLKAKAYSDVKQYDAKHSILHEMISKDPQDFYIDSEQGNIYGLTHSPTGFKIHVPRDVVDDLKLSRKAAAKTIAPVPVGFGQISTATQKLPSQFGSLKSQLTKATKEKDDKAPKSMTPATDAYYAKKQQMKQGAVTTSDFSRYSGYAPGFWYGNDEYSADAQRRIGNLVSGVGLSAAGLASIPVLQYLFPERFKRKGKNLAALAVLGGMTTPWLVNFPGTIADITGFQNKANDKYTDEMSQAYKDKQQAAREMRYVVPGAKPVAPVKNAAFLDMDMPMVKAHMADVLSEQLRSGHIDYGQAAGMMMNAARASERPWFTVRDLAHAAIGAGAGAIAGTAAAKGIGLFMNISPTEQKVMQGTGAALGTLINLGKFGF
jgi:hypothetical protein